MQILIKNVEKLKALHNYAVNKKNAEKLFAKKNIEKGEQNHAASPLIVVKTEIIMHG